MITPEESRPDGAAQDFAFFLAEASEILASSLDYQATLASLARLVVPRLADWCAIDLLEDDGSINQLAVPTRRWSPPRVMQSTCGSCARAALRP